MNFPDAPAVRDAGPGTRSMLDDILEHLSTTSSDALADPNPDEASTAVEEASRTLNVEAREPVPAPRPSDGNCRDGGCE
ncbi:uncharacterized protein B0H18DRAFT_1064243 [Fomitopsis serialis]|uniref:uncharacterized protein n=1 Tax=Fomitopsis serialis TaxID=139415 RepID=UPI0020084159|nr:uncharacterized protein B0H18DRAFT_1064243 [Neoantrodia serialis]KAH9911192.1 hypothetical protein B0H18DRAFT_1064243 [Neoantrodia serialis]